MFTKIKVAFVIAAVGMTSMVWGAPQDKARTETSSAKSSKQDVKQDSSKQELDTSDFMKRKLDGSREIVAGLSTEDYDLIAKHAQDLMLLSHESNWNILQTEAYLQMSSDFRGSAKRLRQAAKDKNLDGATLAYFEMTLNCVRCHKYIRKRQKSGR